MASWMQRMVGAAMLNVATYEEVEGDKRANGQALGVVLLSALAAGIGGMASGERGMLFGAVFAVLGWVVWAALTWIIGTMILPEKGRTSADVGELLRTTGFAQAPGLLRILGPVPLIGAVAQVAAAVWMLVAMVIGVRQALDYSSIWRAVAVCGVGWLVYLTATMWTLALLGLGLRASSGGG